MNRLLLAVMAASMFVHVSPASAQDGKCLVIAKMAEVAMSGRQGGVSLEKALSDSRSTISNESARTMMRTLIIGAYQRTRFSTDQMQQRAIDEYRDEAHVICLTSG